MRFKQKISTRSCLRRGRRAGRVPVRIRPPGVRIRTAGSAASRRTAAGPAGAGRPAPRRPCAAGPGPELRLTADEAVRLALENNLGVRVERLEPQIGTYRSPRRAARSCRTSFRRPRHVAATSPPDFFASGGSADATTSERFQTNFGVQQQVPWGGGRYAVSLDASRQTVNCTSSFNPQLGSNLLAQLHPAAAPQLQDRRQPAAGAAEPGRTRRSPTSSCASSWPRRNARCATRTTTWSARSGSWTSPVSRSNCRSESLREQRAAGRSRHDGADRHHRGRRPKSRATRKR